MTDLTDYRDHCRKQAAADHRPDCPHLCWRPDGRWRTGAAEFAPRPVCDGCMTPGERAAWRKLADEVDAYLAPATAAPDLFGGASEQGVAS